VLDHNTVNVDADLVVEVVIVVVFVVVLDISSWERGSRNRERRGGYVTQIEAKEDRRWSMVKIGSGRLDMK
jgi:hypothetical protein